MGGGDGGGGGIPKEHRRAEMPDGANLMQLPSQIGLTSASQDWRGMIITKIHAFD